MRNANRMTMEWNPGMRTIHGFIYTLRPYERGIQKKPEQVQRVCDAGPGISDPFGAHSPRPQHLGTQETGDDQNPLRDNAKIVITEHGINPTLLLGSLPVEVSPGNGKGVKLIRSE